MFYPDQRWYARLFHSWNPFSLLHAI